MSAHDEDDRELLAKIEALPREIDPGRDLWTGIDSRIQAKRRNRRVNVARVVSIASVATFAAAAAWALYFKPAVGTTPVETPIASVAPVPAVSAPTPALKAVVPEEDSYRAALASLAPTLSQRKAQLPEADVKKIETSLRAIESAVASTRSALAEHADDPDLRAELDAEYEQEIQTINDVLDWTTRS
jgi:hypothetical protein